MKDKKPIDTARAALELLEPQYSGRWNGAFLHRGLGRDPYVSVHYSGREYSSPSPQCYPVSPKCFEELVQKRWVVGVRRLGYTDNDEFRISSIGEIQLGAWRHDDIENARKLLKPGEHGWSSLYKFVREAEFYGKDWEHRKEGFLFQNPYGAEFAVFLDLNKVYTLPDVQVG